MTLLQFADVTYRYRTAQAVSYPKSKAIFEPGEDFYSIIGESGAGKSTLLSLLAGPRY